MRSLKELNAMVINVAQVLRAGYASGGLKCKGHAWSVTAEGMRCIYCGEERPPAGVGA